MKLSKPQFVSWLRESIDAKEARISGFGHFKGRMVSHWSLAEEGVTTSLESVLA